MPTLDSCISNIFEPGNIPASSGKTPTVAPVVPSLEDPLHYHPEGMLYSLDYSKFYNSGYLLFLMV